MTNSSNSDEGKKRTPPTAFVIGSIAFVFLIIGYQTALFIHNAAVAKIVANHDHPDTVYICRENTSPDIGEHATSMDSPTRQHYSKSVGTSGGTVRKEYAHSPEAQQIRLANTPKRCENFKFDPNTVSIEDLMRLGFSQKQAQSIDNYRLKGGRFRRKSDFAKSYVVEDSVYQRLEKYIDIPLTDLNTADSATFETLPGIGKYFASRMVSYRESLGGYSYPEQLMDIRNFDREKFNGLKDLIFIDSLTVTPYPLWTLPEEQLARHPYIGRYSAHSIIIFRENTPKSGWSVAALADAGILKKDLAHKLSRCAIAQPE